MSGKLPSQITPFVGRKRELAQLDELLRDPDCRLITILGPGGIGKTRLAIEVASAAAGRYAFGVAYADLQSLGAVEYLPETIAEGIGLQLAGEDTTERLIDYLQEKELLLLLDNFEHLLDGAELVSRLLMAAPAVRCIATSRQVLNLQEEWLYPLPGLEVPTESGESHASAEHVDAVQLFAQRARRVRRDFDLNAELAGVVRICQLVEGMPLAIELAASWTRTLSTATIAGEIEQGLDFLSTGIRNMPARHRSMHAALYQSWQQLDGQEQMMFAGLSVFRGGFRRKAAHAVTGATLPFLTDLVDRSLLRWESDGRYTVHELIRQYGAERLAENPDAHAQAHRLHCTTYADFLSERSDIMFGPRQYEVLEELRPELDNIRIALQWAIENAELETLDRLAYHYYMYCDWRGHYRENTDVLEQAVGRLAELDQTGDVRRSAAACYAYLGWCYIRLGRLQDAVDASERSEALYGETGTQPAPAFGTEPLAGLALAHHVLGNYKQAFACADEARRRSVLRGDDLNLMIAQYVLCTVCLARDELASARLHGLAAASLAEQYGHSWFQAYILMELGNTALAEGDLAEARRYYQESYHLKEVAVDPEGMAVALNQLGQIALMEGDYRQAEHLHRRSLAFYERVSDPGGRAITLHGLANAAAACKNVADAADLYRQTLAILLDIRFWPRALAVLVDVADYLSAVGWRDDASGLLAAVLAHPASDGMTQRRVRDLLKNRPDAFPSVTSLCSQESASAELAAVITQALEALDALKTAESERLTALDPVAAANLGLIEPLTPRELEVLHLLADGMTNPQIAEHLILSVGTVKSYTAQIYGKLAVGNRTQAVNRARELGLLGGSR